MAKHPKSGPMNTAARISAGERRKQAVMIGTPATAQTITVRPGASAPIGKTAQIPRATMHVPASVSVRVEAVPVVVVCLNGGDSSASEPITRLLSDC
ncbi:hypothetical protein ACFCYB_42850 [Streptomyces sp. NPDC056309]|uniref:hypothetical protein n=1 Tax=unclassified Streptomyces TaxID=2593676 RepID=UPI0035D58FBB